MDKQQIQLHKYYFIEEKFYYVEFFRSVFEKNKQ